MGTQAIVSVRQNGKMAMKLVCGCGGAQARTLADAIQSLGRVPTPLEAPAIARNAHFGCDACLVVVTLDTVITCADAYEKPKEFDNPNGFELYFKTLDNPTFNPRWANGMAAHVEIVDF